MTLDEQAVYIWEKLKSQLEDRSVLHLGSVDDETMAELDAEQVAAIAAGLVVATEMAVNERLGDLRA